MKIFKLIILVILMSMTMMCTSCAILDKLDFPDDIHEQIEHQGPTVMSTGNDFGK